MPIVKANSWWFIQEHEKNRVRYDEERIKRDWNSLWDGFVLIYESLSDNGRDIDDQSFNRAVTDLLKLKGMGMAYLSFFLFWIDSDRFCCFDSSVRSYVGEFMEIEDYEDKKNEGKCGLVYLSSLQEMKNNPELSDFKDVSWKAYMESKKLNYDAVDISAEEWKDVF